MSTQQSDNWKPSNPKDIVGVQKIAFDCLPWQVLINILVKHPEVHLQAFAEMAIGMHEGAFKYGRFNYREIGVCASTYLSACLRHLSQWYCGEDIDDVSNLHHVTKFSTSLAVMIDAKMNGMLTDDRPPVSKGLRDIILAPRINQGNTARQYFLRCFTLLTVWYEGYPGSDLYLDHALVDAMFLRSEIINGKLEDDRPQQSSDWVSGLNDKTKILCEKFPNPCKPYTEKPL